MNQTLCYVHLFHPGEDEAGLVLVLERDLVKGKGYRVAFASSDRRPPSSYADEPAAIRALVAYARRALLERFDGNAYGDGDNIARADVIAGLPFETNTHLYIVANDEDGLVVSEDHYGHGVAPMYLPKGADAAGAVTAFCRALRLRLEKKDHRVAS